MTEIILSETVVEVGKDSLDDEFYMYVPVDYMRQRFTEADLKRVLAEIEWKKATNR